MFVFTDEDLRLIRKSGLFDEKWYLEQYPDVAMVQMPGLDHYAWIGARLGRQPSPNFNRARYMAGNQTHTDPRIDPFLQFVRQHQGNTNLGNSESGALAAALATGPKLTANITANSRVVAAIGRQVLPNGDLSAEAKAVCEQIIAERGAPRISVIVPTWNRQDTVCVAIDSILKQSVLPCEIIISDDGSTDGTLELVRCRYAKELQSGLLKLLENPHRGVCPTRNAGLAVASGEIIAYLDSDNRWRPDYLLVVSAFFQENLLEDCVYTGFQWHNLNTKEVRYCFRDFDRRQLIDTNFIDLNCFAHRRTLYDQQGGFDVELTRLVDWDFIIRCTNHSDAVGLNFCGVDYYLDKERLGNITFTVNLEKNRSIIYRKNFQERVRRGLEELRIAYFIYDFPALSQTFVFNEIRWLVQNGFDVVVYYAVDAPTKAKLDFDVRSEKVANADDLAQRLAKDRRNIIHTHFAYPGVALFVQPACRKAEISYTFMPHAVDIFHNDNQQRCKVSETASDPRCLRVFVYGDFHRKYLEGLGVPASKIAYTFQAVNSEKLGSCQRNRDSDKPLVGIVIARFIEKKGIETLIEAASRLKDLNIRFDLYGYGELEESYRKRIAELSLDNFVFKGTFDGIEAERQIFASADFLLAPCVRAANGDMDGFPTVILEALASGVPVIAAHVSAIPDYLRDGLDAYLTKPGDPEELALAIRRLHATPVEQVNAMVARAQRHLATRVGVSRTMQNLLDTWTGYKATIFLVTYNNEKYENTQDTLEIIDRIIKHTTLEHELIIVDNNSDPIFCAAVRRRISGLRNAKFVTLRDNILCGPASNLALRFGDSEFAIYICSKEGFIKEHGWDQQIVNWMRNRQEVALGGYKTHMPRFTLGKDLALHPDFSKFRYRDYTSEASSRPFGHVQGGTYCIRREALATYGFFSDSLPQDHMDVEFSYFLESQGAKIDRIPGVVSISAKTRPELHSVITESTLIAHPLSAGTVSKTLDAAKSKDVWRCNLCNTDHRILRNTYQPICPSCGSTAFDRAVYARIAHDFRMHRELPAAFLCESAALAKVCERAFRVVHDTTADQVKIKLAAAEKLELVVVDWDQVQEDQRQGLVQFLTSKLSATAAVIGASSDGWRPTIALAGFKENIVDSASSFLRSDWRALSIHEVNY